MGVRFQDGVRLTLGGGGLVRYRAAGGELVQRRSEVPAGGKVAERLECLDLLGDYMAKYLAGAASTTGGEAGQQVVAWNRHPNFIAIQLSEEVVQLNCLASHAKVVVWRRGGVLLLTLLSPGGGETWRVDGRLAPALLDTVGQVLAQLTCLAKARREQ